MPRRCAGECDDPAADSSSPHDDPAANGSPPGRYWVTVRFFINKDGSISNPTIEEDPGYGTGAEVLRVMSKSPAWQPAVYNGQVVKSYQQRVIIFQVTEM